MADYTDHGAVGLVQRTLIITGVVVAVAVLLWLIWQIPDVVLLIFAGILLAVFLRGLARLLGRYLHLPLGWATILGIMLFFLSMAGGALLFGPAVVSGFEELSQTLPSAIDSLDDYLHQFPALHGPLQTLMQNEQSALFNEENVKRITGIFSTALGMISGVLIILAIGLYISIEPQVYLNGLVRLFPISRRDRVRSVLDRLGDTLIWWLIGRLLAMLIVGVLTWAGLLLLGVPSALALGVLAGLLDFIPNIGPLLAAAPAVLLAFSQDQTTALYVAILYFAVQNIEGYLATPLIQRRTVSMPPALLMAVQLAAGVALGLLGLLLATPLAVVAMVLIEALYIEDTLGDRDKQT